MPDTEQPADNTHAVHVKGTITPGDDFFAGLRDDFAKLREDQQRIKQDTAKALGPLVRIVHPGGPARKARVYINGVEARTASRVEMVLYASHPHGVHTRIEFVGRPPLESANAQIDVAAEAAEMVEAKPPRFFWPVLFGLILDAIPAGLAWWSWDRSGWLATVVFVLSVMGGVVWTFGVLGTFVGLGRAMAAAERAYGEKLDDTQDGQS